MLIFEKSEYLTHWHLHFPNAVREFEIPKECCFLFWSKPFTNANSVPLCNPLGVARLRCVTLVYISTNGKLAKGTCPDLSCQNKVLFMWTRPLIRMIEFTPNSLVAKRKFFATCFYRACKETIFFATGCVTAGCVFVWGERDCVVLLTWTIACVLYMGFVIG